VLPELAAFERAVLLEDVLGELRVVLWCGSGTTPEALRRLHEALSEASGAWWTGEIWNAAAASEVDKALYERAWQEARPDELDARLRLADRHRSRVAWFQDPGSPPWSAPAGGPPILVFYSFKGGMGRSTALSAFAIQRARAGETVAVVDLDLDAPGVGSLLAADATGTTASWGVVDYLIERARGDVDLRSYYHACRRPEVVGNGEIVVIPAGKVDEGYLSKLARIDFDPAVADLRSHPLGLLLEQVRSELNPSWILLDSRTGLSEPAGILLSGIAHLHVLLGSASDQSWRGLQIVLKHLGADRVHLQKAQLECILVHAMVPADVETATRVRSLFESRAREVFREFYYAEDPSDPATDDLWYVRDLEDEQGPHAPIALSYSLQLAFFGDVAGVADLLAESKEYKVLGDRIVERFLEFDE
jgi:hypothetical protein